MAAAAFRKLIDESISCRGTLKPCDISSHLFNKTANKGTPQMATDKEAIS